MWELYHKEGWALKNWCFQTVVLEKTLESPLDRKKIKLVNPKGNQLWISIGRTSAEAPIFWPPDAKIQLIGKDPHAGKNRGKEEKGATGWDIWMASLTQWAWVWANSGSWYGQGSLACCSPWGRRVRHDWVTELNYQLVKVINSYKRGLKYVTKDTSL